MLDALKKIWHELANERPGRRFRRRFQNLHRGRERAHRQRARVLRVSAGIALIAVGIVLLAIPGPGTVVVVIGAALLAQESSTVSRLLDRLEVRLHKLTAWAASWWHHASPAARAVPLLIGAALLGGALWLAYSLLFLR